MFMFFISYFQSEWLISIVMWLPSQFPCRQHCIKIAYHFTDPGCTEVTLNACY